MEKADGLSRRLDWKVGVEKDNNNQIFIKGNWIRSLEEVVIVMGYFGHEQFLFSFSFIF